MFISIKMFALKTLRNIQKYTVTVINPNFAGQPNQPIGLLKFTSGNYPRNQMILNLPVTNPYTTQPLTYAPDAGTWIVWDTQTQNLFTNPLTASVFHATPLTNNLNVFIGNGTPNASISLLETTN